MGTPAGKDRAMDDLEIAAAYAAPAAAALAEPASETAEDDDADVVRLIGRWERRRIRYNAILTATVLLVTAPDLLRPFADPAFWGLLAAGCVGANACFFAGPLAEAYLRWLGLKGAIGWVLFVLGLVVAVPLTMLVVAGYYFSQMWD